MWPPLLSGLTSMLPGRKGGPGERSTRARSRWLFHQGPLTGRGGRQALAFVLTAGQRYETTAFERLINRLKQHRRVATRYEKRAGN